MAYKGAHTWPVEVNNASKYVMPIPGEGEYLSGFVFDVAILLLLLLSLAPIRRRCFEVFYAAHVLFAVVAAAAGLLHGGVSGVGLALWLADIIARYAYVFPLPISLSTRIVGTCLFLHILCAQIEWRSPLYGAAI